MLAVVTTSLPWNAAYGYRFLQEPEDSYSTTGPNREPYSPRPIKGLDPDFWPPGAELRFVMYESPHWAVAFDDMDEAKRVFEEAMAEWSSIDSADILWSLRVLPAEDEPQNPIEQARLATVRVNESDQAFRTQKVTTGRGSESYHSGCRISVGRSFLSTLKKDEVRFAFVHELGHCLGLDTPGSYTPFARRPSEYESPSGWNHEPIMGDGTGPLTADDRAGVSLIRPAPGWLDRVGSILGYVLTDDDEHARFVYVLATRVRPDGTLAESVGRLTDRAGVFVIGGLAPGDYVLSVRPFRGHTGVLHLPLYLQADQGLPLVFGESFLAAPVAVAAGRQAGPVGLTIRPAEGS